MRRRPSMWVQYALNCDRPPAVDRDTLAYRRGKFDGRETEREYWEDQLRRAAELVEFLEQVPPDPEFDQ